MLPEAISVIRVLKGPVSPWIGNFGMGGEVEVGVVAVEAEGEPPSPPTTKTRTEILQVLQSLPKQFLRHQGISFPIGMGKGVALGRSGATNRREGARVQR
jgi:hypothetical protein